MGWLEETAQRGLNLGGGAMLGQMTNTGIYGGLIASDGGNRNPLDPSAYYRSSSGSSTPMIGANANARNADMEAGYGKGKEIFYDDPEMQAMRARREDLSKGYNGQELGAMREQARNEIQGQRQGYLRQLAGKAARGGIGGARAAAMQGAADQGFQKNSAELERKMVLDNANLTRQGTDSLQDFLMKQKYGMLGTGLGYGQLGVADRTADTQAQIAAKEPKKGLITSMLSPLIDGMF